MNRGIMNKENSGFHGSNLAAIAASLILPRMSNDEINRPFIKIAFPYLYQSAVPCSIFRGSNHTKLLLPIP
jgi:hypothetical protein